MREAVAENRYYASLRDLFDACKAFIDRTNADSQQIVSQLWPKNQIDPGFEKLLVSS